MKSKNEKSTRNNNNNIGEKFEKMPLKSPPKEFVIDAKNYKQFSKLKIENTVKTIKKKDLPEEFSSKTCEFIDIFRRKTANEKTEWNFYIDYENEQIIHCIYGEPTEVTGWINQIFMENKKILTIHNHITGTYSAPSPENFEILGHEFENYEIICAENEFWLLEFKGYYDKTSMDDFKEEIQEIFDYCDSFRKINPQIANMLYTTHLKNYIKTNYENILLRNKEYDVHGQTG